MLYGGRLDHRLLRWLLLYGRRLHDGWLLDLLCHVRCRLLWRSHLLWGWLLYLLCHVRCWLLRRGHLLRGRHLLCRLL